MVDVSGILEPAVEPEASFVTEVPKWCQYFFSFFEIFFWNFNFTGLADENLERDAN
jgi:hypothetical protein